MRELAEKRTTWESPLSKETVEGGLALENGLRNLVISFLPPNLLKIVSFLGFKGVRSVAFAELNKSAFQHSPGMYGAMAQYVLCMYWLVVEMHACLGPVPKEYEVLQKEIEKRAAVNPGVSVSKYPALGMLSETGF